MNKFISFMLLSLGLLLFLSPSTFAQAICPTPAPNTSWTICSEDSFLSVKDSTSQNNFYNFSTFDPSIIGPSAGLPKIAIPTYGEMKSIYYDQNKYPGITKPPFFSGDQQYETVIPNMPNSRGLYNIKNGNLTVNNALSLASGQVAVIFIDKDLHVKNNFAATNKDQGIVFVVGGDVYIDQGVTSVSAVIITFGSFCSASSGDFSSLISCSNSQSKLTINGSLIHLAPPNTPQLQFTRSNQASGNSEPGEEIIYDPKYLVILKDIFAKDLTVWNEIQ